MSLFENVYVGDLFLLSLLFTLVTAPCESQSPGIRKQSCRIPWPNSCIDMSLFAASYRQQVAQLEIILDEQDIFHGPSSSQKGC